MWTNRRKKILRGVGTVYRKFHKILGSTMAWHSHFQDEHALRDLIPFLAFKKSEQSLSFSQVTGFSLRILVIVFLLRSRYTDWLGKTLCFYNQQGEDWKNICSTELRSKFLLNFCNFLFGVFIINFEHISLFFLVLLLLASSMHFFAGSHSVFLEIKEDDCFHS